MARFIDVCSLAARKGGQTLLEMATPQMVRAKSARDLVTDADLASQRVIMDCLREAFPAHGLLGEESDNRVTSRGDTEPYLWVVDPLDGTTNFVHKVPFWGVSVALLEAGQPIAGTVYDPLRDECFSAELGHGSTLNGVRMETSGAVQLTQAVIACSFSAEVTRDSAEVARFLDLLPHARAVRRMGSTALNLAYVAAGRFDGFFTQQTNVWDVAAGGLLVREAGGAVCAMPSGDWQPLVDPALLATATEALRADISRRWPCAE